MKIVRVSDYDEFKGSKEEWGALLSRSGTSNIFLTYEWIDACIRHFLKGRGLLILKVLDADRLIGIAPLMIKRSRYLGFPVKTVSFIGTLISDRMDFIVDGDKRKIMGLVLDYLMHIEREWDFIDLREIPDDTGTMDAVKEWLRNRKGTNILGPSSKAFFVDFGGQQAVALSQIFSKKFHKEYRQAKNKGTDLDLKFERYTNETIIGAERFFSEICAIEGNSWQGRARKGIFSKEDNKSFHGEIFDRFSKNRWIDLSILRLDGKPIAYKYDYLYRQRLYSYNQSFDEKYSHLSPGTMLMMWALKDSAEKGISEFDFLKGEEKWKAALTQSFKVHDRIRISGNAFYPRCLTYLRTRFIPYVKNIKAVYRVWKKIREVLGWD